MTQVVGEQFGRDRGQGAEATQVLGATLLAYANRGGMVPAAETPDAAACRQVIALRRRPAAVNPRVAVLPCTECSTWIIPGCASGGATRPPTSKDLTC